MRAGNPQWDSVVRLDALEDEAAYDEQQSLQVKLVELSDANHKLRVENIALRASASDLTIESH
jgi:hypothetical protein